MLYAGRDLTRYLRPDLIKHVLDHCVEIPVDRLHDLYHMIKWCEERFGEPRPGSILKDAMEGWLDHLDGDWCDLYDDLDRTKYLFWFYRDEDRVLFTLTWL